MSLSLAAHESGHGSQAVGWLRCNAEMAWLIVTPITEEFSKHGICQLCKFQPGTVFPAAKGVLFGSRGDVPASLMTCIVSVHQLSRQARESTFGLPKHGFMKISL